MGKNWRRHILRHDIGCVVKLASRSDEWSDDCYTPCFEDLHISACTTNGQEFLYLLHHHVAGRGTEITRWKATANPLPFYPDNCPHQVADHHNELPKRTIRDIGINLDISAGGAACDKFCFVNSSYDAICGHMLDEDQAMKFIQLGRKYQKVALTREGMHYWAIDMDGHM